MLDSLIYSINAILPICLVMLLGKLVSGRIVPKEFFATADKLVFNFTLPVLLFESVASASFSLSDTRLFVFALVGIVLSIALPWAIAPIFIKNRASCGAFIQGIFRSNTAILGLPLAIVLFGDEGRAKFSIVISFTLVLFNIFAVVLLTVFSPKEEEKKSRGRVAKELFLGIIKNPLVIGTLLGLPFMLLESLTLPTFAETTVDYIARITTPMALLSLGASVSFSKSDGRLKLAIIASLIKSFVLPSAAVAAAYFLGFRGVDIGVIFILFAVPSAIASYVMSKNMKSDYILSGQIIVMTTVMSMVSMFLGLFIMKSLSII